MLKKPALVVLILFASALLFGKSDPREEYVVAVCEFTALGLPREHAYLAETLPRLMLHSLSGLENRFFDDDEKQAYIERYAAENKREGEIAKAQKAQKASLSALHSGTPVESPAENEETEDIRPPPDEKPLQILNTSGEILPLPVNGAHFCREKDADMLISGRIEAIGSLVFFSLSAYSFAAGSWDEFFVSTTGSGSLEESLAQAEGALRKKVLGRPWGTLSLSTNRRDAHIYLDNELRGVGTLNSLVLKPGEYPLRIEAEAAETLKTIVEIPESEERVLEFTLQDEPPAPLGVTSLPAGADVYLSSKWVGKTPLFLPPAGRDGTMRLVMEGFRDVLIPTGELDTGKNGFTLERRYYDPELALEKKRDSLYTAVGLFTLSLPFTMFSYSLYRDYWNQASMYNDAALSEQAFLYNGMFYAGLYGSSVLFAHMVTALMEYRSAGEETF